MFDRFFKDKNGEIVIWQRPNALLWTWIILAILQRLIAGETISRILGAASLIAIVLWALQEIRSGVNLFRRMLGGVVLAVVIVTRFI